jgi:hypothetical protein
MRRCRSCLVTSSKCRNATFKLSRLWSAAGDIIGCSSGSSGTWQLPDVAQLQQSHLGFVSTRNSIGFLFPQGILSFGVIVSVAGCRGSGMMEAIATRPRRPALVAGVAGVLCLTFASVATAQVGSLGGAGGPSLSSPPVIVSRDDPFARPSNNYSALPVGGWLLYPTLFVGTVFDDNVTQSATDKTSSTGARLVPSLLAEATDGIHKSTFYGMADARVYADPGNNGDTVTARTGFMQRYQPMPDLVFNAQADYTRQKDLFSTFGIDHSVTTLNPTAVGLAPTVNPIAYNQFSGTASVQKMFGQAFINFGGSVVDIVYDHGAAAGVPSANGTTYTGIGRGGFWFTPFLYVYGEGSVDQRRYTEDLFNSSGYRAVGGIGSDQIGLFRGEVYGGYQSEQFDSSVLGTVDGTVMGGKAYYYPLRELTISASVDESLGVTLLQPTLIAPGTSTRATTTLLQATYALAQEWAASGRFGFIHTAFTDTIRIDNAWTAGATVTYSVWQNFGLTFDYQHVQVSSNVPLQSVTRDVVTLGATYKY